MPVIAPEFTNGYGCKRLEEELIWTAVVKKRVKGLETKTNEQQHEGALRRSEGKAVCTYYNERR